MIFNLLLGCSNDDGPNETNITYNFTSLPLKAGNQWVYNYYTPTDTGEHINSIQTAITLNGIDGYQLNNDWLFDNDGCYYKDGNLYGCKISDPTSTAEIVFPNNPSINQTWMVDTYTWKLEQKGISVTVPAGTFNCYKIIATKNVNTYILYWAIEKGIIKFEDNAGTEKSELKNIIIK